MAMLSPESLGNKIKKSIWGDVYGDVNIDGDLLDGELYEVPTVDAYNSEVVTDEALTEYIEYSATTDVELKHITFPPDPGVTLRLASEFYETYLADTDIDKIEAIDRYCVALIEKVEAQARRDATENPELALVIEEALAEFSQEVEDYANAVHNAAVNELQAA